MPVNSFEDYPMSFKPVKNKTNKPLYLDLADQLETNIRSGKLTPGTKLPPQRELADYLDINLSTITRAFKLCEKSGLICSAVGKGTYVSSDAAANSVLLGPTSSKVIKMGAILPDSDTNKIAADLLTEMSKEPDFYKQLEYAAIDYDYLQLKAAAKWLDYSCLDATRGEILFSSGGQNGIFATLASLFHSGDKIATMPSTYPGVKSAAKILGIQLISLPLKNGILDWQDLQYVLDNNGIKGLYFISDFNNPTTESLDLTTRKAIGAFCEENDILLVEDAIYTLFQKDPLPPISVFAPTKGIFISSVSKVLAPGLRLAVLSIPKEYTPAIRECLYAMQITSATLMMQLFTRLVLSGMCEKIRTQRIERIMEQNRLFDEVLPEVTSYGSCCSPIRWVKIPEIFSPSAFERKALNAGLQIYGADRFAVGTSPIPNAIRVSLISVNSKEEYLKGLHILKELLVNPS